MAVLAAYEWGDPHGRPVICIHGVTGHGGRFADLAERLRGCRVVGLDLRGHGRSTFLPPWDAEQHVADLVETTAALGVEGAAWVGHSFGGRLVVELAARHPDLVERAVLLDPALFVDPVAAMGRAELLRTDVSFATPDEAIEARLADGTLFSTPRSILEREADVHLEPGPDGRHRWRYSAPAVTVAWSVMSSPPPPWPSCATLIVVGERSWIPLDVPEALDAEVVTVPGGHSVLWDDFDATAVAIAGFLVG